MKSLNRAQCLSSLAALLLAGGCRQKPGDDASRSAASIPAPPLPPGESESISSPITNVYPPVNLAVSPDGRWLACRQKQSEAKPADLLLFEAATGKRSDQKPLELAVSGDLRWSGSSRLVVSGSAAQVWKITAQGRLAPVALFPDDGSRNRAPLMPDEAGITHIPPRLVQSTAVSSLHQLGARLVSVNGSGEAMREQVVELFSPANKRGLGRIRPPKFMPSNSDVFQFSPAGAPRLLIAEYPRDRLLQFSLWEPRTRRRLWQQSLSGLNPSLDWTPDARFLIATQVTGSHGRDLFPLHETLVYDAKTGQKVRSLPTQNTVYAATVAGDTLITYGTQHRPEKKQHWTSLQSTNWRNGQKIFHCWMPAGTGYLTSIAASPRSGTIFGNRDGLMLWRLADLKAGRGAPKTVQAANEEVAAMP